MGVISMFSSCSCSTQTVEVERIVKLPNPDPENYRILQTRQVGPFAVVKVKYPDCKNYEGNKVMVYESSIDDIMGARKLDPHFCKKCLSPIARFRPTKEGWEAAVIFAEIMEVMGH